jgi:hypothetical protein
MFPDTNFAILPVACRTGIDFYLYRRHRSTRTKLITLQASTGWLENFLGFCLIKNSQYRKAFQIFISFTNYTISVHNANYFLAPPFHFHNIFRPYMAIIRCSFDKICFTVWCISLLLCEEEEEEEISCTVDGNSIVCEEYTFATVNNCGLRI